MNSLKYIFLLSIFCALQVSCTFGQKIYTGQEVFGPVVNDLKNNTNVPLRLPNYIAAEVAADPHGFSAKINEAELQNYSIHIVTRPNCNGQTYCLDGLVTAKKTTTVISFSNAEQVNLTNGIQGYYVGFECAASCGMGKIYWKEGSYQYSIQIRATPKNYMIDIANSAINNNVAD